MYKSLESLRIWLLAGISLLQACGSGTADPSILALSFPHQRRPDCQNITLSEPRLNASQIRAISRCLNSDGQLGPIDQAIQKASGPQLETLAHWANEQLIARPQILFELEKSFEHLDQSGLLDAFFNEMGTWLDRPEIQDSLEFFLQSFPESSFLSKIEWKLFLKRENLIKTTELLIQTVQHPEFQELRPALKTLFPSIDPSLNKAWETIFSKPDELLSVLRTAHESTTSTSTSPFLQVLENSSELSSLLVSLPKSELWKPGIEQVAVLFKGGQLKTIFHIVLKMFHSYSATAASTSSWAPIDRTYVTETVYPGDISVLSMPMAIADSQTETTDFTPHPELASFFTLVRKSPRLIPQTLSWLSRYSGRESDVFDWFVKSAEDGTLKKIELMIQSADTSVFTTPNLALKYMGEIGESKDQADLEKTYTRLQKRLKTYRSLTGRKLTRWVIRKELHDALDNASESVAALEESLNGIGGELIRDLFHDLDSANLSRDGSPRKRSRNALSSVIHLSHAGFFSSLSDSLTGLSPARKRLVSQAFKNWIQIFKSHEARTFLQTLSKAENEQTLYSVLHWIHSHPEHARRLAINHSNILSLDGSWIQNLMRQPEWILSNWETLLTLGSSDPIVELLEGVRPMIKSAVYP